MLTPTLILLLAAGVPAKARDCDALYYGIGQAKDLKAAYDCYAAEKDFPMQLVMLMNGEGTPVDLGKAQALFGAWEKAERWDATESLQAEALRKALAERVAKPGAPFARLDFCGDIAGDTINVNHCAAIQQRLAQEASAGELVALRAKLSPQAATALDALRAALEIFKAAEGKRAYQEYSEGTIRNVAALTQEQLVASHFMREVRAVVGKRQLASATDAAYKAADDRLNKTYTSVVAAYASGYDDKDAITTYRQLAKDAQLAWSKYRDAWLPLVTALFGDDPARRSAILTLVTKDRDDELTSDPVGGD